MSVSYQDCVIVSRHPATIQFILTCLRDQGMSAEEAEHLPVISRNATKEDVAGKVVYGNIPLSLASQAKLVYAVEFSGSPPRGQEYTLEDMLAAKACLRPYKVFSGEAWNDLVRDGEQGPLALKEV